MVAATQIMLLESMYEKGNKRECLEAMDVDEGDTTRTPKKQKTEEQGKIIQGLILSDSTVNEEDINLWVGHTFINPHILGGMCRSSTEKVTHVQTQLAVHEVTIQVLEPIKYKTIAEEANTWGAYVSSLVGPTSFIFVL